MLSLSAAVGLGAALNLLIGSTNRTVDETFAAQDRTADVELVGQPASPTLQRPLITAGGPPAAGQILVSEQTADALGVAAGQRVRVATANGARDMVVSGTARTLASAQSDLPDDQAAALLGLSGRSNALFVAASDTAAQSLRDRPEVARVTSLATARSGMHDLVRELTGLIDVLLAISLGVGQAWFRIGLHPAPSNFALVIALAIALALLAAGHSVRRVLRLDIASAVRARLIG